MGFHLNDMTPDALVDADLIRLDFVNRMGIFNNKATLYEESLRSMENHWTGTLWLRKPCTYAPAYTPLRAKL